MKYETMETPVRFDATFMALSGALSIGIVILDKDYRVLHWNEWLAKHSGIAAERAQGASLYELWPELLGSRVHDAVAQAMLLGQPALLSGSLNKDLLPLYVHDAQGQPQRLRLTICITPFMLDQAGRHCVMQINDVSAAFERENALRRKAALLKDSLAQQVDILRRLEMQNDQLDTLVKQRTEQLHELARYLQDVSEHEKAVLARELHDELGALLTAMKIDLFTSAKLTKNVLPDVHEKLMRALDYLNSGLSLKRRIVSGMRPSTLTHLGLPAALKWLAQEMAQVNGWALTCKLDENTATIPDDHSVALYRVAQESLTNVAKHAAANAVQIELHRDENHVWLRIKDDGRGFDSIDVNDPVNHGLAGMRNRIEARGGKFGLQSAIGEGMEIRVSLPII